MMALRLTLQFMCLVPIWFSCHQAASLSEARVVEQSRRERPAWVGDDLSSVIKTGEVIAYHDVKTKVIDLPLGLKQAEASALNDTRLQIQNEIVRFWKKDKLFQDLDSSDRTVVMRELERLLEARITPSLIRDIYFEKIFDPNAVTSLQDTYNVHVLVRIDRATLQQLLSDVRNYCRNSLRQGLIRLAQNEQVFSAQP